MCVRQLLGNFFRFSGQFIPIGQQNHGFMIAFCAFEGFDRCFQCNLHIGSAGWDCIGIKGIGQLKKTGFVDRQRTLQECVSGECNQAEPVGGIVFDNLLNEPLCLFHTGRFDVIGKHTF